MELFCVVKNFKQWFRVSFSVLIIAWCFQIKWISAGCRPQVSNKCEAICQRNSTLKTDVCTLRAIVILPNMTRVEASLPRVSGFIFPE